MDLIMNLCERIQVLAHGERIFEGTPAEVQAVRASGRSISAMPEAMVARGGPRSVRPSGPARGRRTSRVALRRGRRDQGRRACMSAPGEVVALLGANGAGKSTMLRTISGLIRPRSGTIRFAGERIDRLPPSRIVRLGIAHCPEGRRVFGAPDRRGESAARRRRPRRSRSALDEDRERIYDALPDPAGADASAGRHALRRRAADAGARAAP